MEILFVEDDERVRRFVLRGLEAEGYTVSIAADGNDGLARAREGDFDVIVLDVMLPGMDGRSLCQALRTENIPTPVLMLTALDHLDDKVGALRGGADDYLTKPFDFDELLARIEALARRGRGYNAEPPRVVEFGEFLLDRQAMRVSLNDEPVELTAKEYQLLELFVNSPRRVLSRSRILNKVWGYDSDPLTNVVDVYVRRIRQKLGWEADRGLIKTIRSYGYRFDPK